jgi:uncharacterized protein YjbI with pentapeptide repeats
MINANLEAGYLGFADLSECICRLNHFRDVNLKFGTLISADLRDTDVTTTSVDKVNVEHSIYNSSCVPDVDSRNDRLP